MSTREYTPDEYQAALAAGEIPSGTVRLYAPYDHPINAGFTYVTRCGETVTMLGIVENSYPLRMYADNGCHYRTDNGLVCEESQFHGVAFPKISPTFSPTPYRIPTVEYREVTFPNGPYTYRYVNGKLWERGIHPADAWEPCEYIHVDNVDAFLKLKANPIKKVN